MELTEEFAGIYARPMGHPDTAARYNSLLGKELMATFASPKGWYDAGDYGKYIVNSGISTYTLLQLYQHNKEYFKSLSLNIPESKNDVPDILDEIRWKLQGWQTTSALAAFTIATNPDVFEQVDVDSAKALILHLADDYIKSLKNNGYGVAMTEGDFYWGSNSVAANKGIVLLHAYILTKKEEYLNAATGILDYLLGRNPLNLSYLTGYGVNQVFNPHHRPSQADSIDAPIPGMLVGGPNKSANDCAKKYIDNEAVARSYYDNACSYATNEVAINWNAPFAYLAGSIHSIISSGKTYDIHSSVEKFEINGIPSGKPNFSKNLNSGVRMIFREGSVQLEKTTKTGMKIYYNLKGKKLN